MTGYFLAVDIGNSKAHFGLFNKDRLLLVEAFAHSERATALQMLFSRWRIDPRIIDASGISSVIPNATNGWAHNVFRALGKSPRIITGLTTPQFHTLYEDPNQLGNDRICKIIAAQHYFNPPLIAVDVGSAVTIDYIDKTGLHLGGTISLGPTLQARGINMYTAQLPRVGIEGEVTAFSRETTQAVRSGIMMGTAGAIDNIVDQMELLSEKVQTVVATGGVGRLIKPYSRRITDCDPYLVLQGIRLICTGQDK